MTIGPLLRGACLALLVALATLALPAPSSATTPPPLPMINPLMAQPDALALTIVGSGLATIVGSELAAAGWNLAAIDPRGIHLFRQGVELPLAVGGLVEGELMRPEATLRFHSSGNRSRYSDQAVYWLTHDLAPGLRTPLQPTAEPLRWEQDARYDSRAAHSAGGGWFARELFAGESQSVTLDLPTAAPAGTTLRLKLQGETLRGHTLSLTANGVSAGTLRWSDAEHAPLGPAQPYTGTLSLRLPLPAGPLRLDLRLDSPGLPTDVVLLDWVELSDLPAPVAAASVRLLARRAPIDLLAGPAPGRSGADYLIISHGDFIPALAPLVASKERQGRQVAVVDVQAAYDAFSFGEQHPEALRSLIRSAAARWQPAPRAVLLVGAGTVRMRPTIVGQENEGTDTFIPPYLVDADPWLGEITCDTCYVRLDTADPLDDPLPDIPIGRFPVRSLAEAEALVAKTVGYTDAPPPGDWQNTALLLADNDLEADGSPDQVGGFVATAEAAATLLPPQIRTERLYYDPTSGAGSPRYADAAALRCQLFQALDGGAACPGQHRQTAAGSQGGAALLLYVGHGSPWQWGVTSYEDPAPYLWYLYDADSRRNAGRLPILLAMTCLTGAWHNPELQTTDERLLLKPDGGIIASLSAAGLGVNSGHETLLRGLLPRLFTDKAGAGTLGQAHLAGLTTLLATGCCQDLAYTYSILGDPDVAPPLQKNHRVYLPFATKH